MSNRQSRTMSAIEAGANVLIGYLIATGTAALWYWWNNIQISTAGQFELGLILTAVSLVRSYLLRRYFNNLGGLIGKAFKFR